MNLLKYFSFCIFILLFLSCNNGNEKRIIYNGRVEANIISLSAQVGGILDIVRVDEGDAVRKDQLLFKINTDKVETQLKRQKAQIAELKANMAANDAQIKQVNSQLKLARQTLDKTKKLVNEGAATQQQQDELESKVEVLHAQKESLLTNRNMLKAKNEQLAAAIELTQISINDAEIVSPIDGIVLNRFLDQSELASPGRTLVELADLTSMEVTIYVSLSDLNKVKIGEEVDINVDGLENNLSGTVRWIASEAEFTPKTILTKETRTTLVYAVKIAVDNPDGVLKIGMPVDVLY